MGQCVLRDLGFDFEKDDQSKKMLDDYIKEKLAAKYPNAANYKNKTPDEATPTSGKDSSPASKSIASRTREEFAFDGRLSRPARRTRTKEIEVQTEDANEKDEAADLKIIENRVIASQKEGSSSINSSHFNISGAGNNSTPLKGLRFKSENTLGSDVSHMRKSSVGAKTNIFNGIERINFKEPAQSQRISTGRSANPMVKGFENRYFRVSRNRTPSPMGTDVKVFDDDEDL